TESATCFSRISSRDEPAIWLSRASAEALGAGAGGVCRMGLIWSTDSTGAGAAGGAAGGAVGAGAGTDIPIIAAALAICSGVSIIVASFWTAGLAAAGLEAA